MNIRTERLDNHMARLEVSIEPEQLEKAKGEAARRLGKRVNLPGFRKGKAPYSILVRYLGETAIIEEALEVLGDELYKSALDESGLEPYGAGQLDDFKLDPPTMVFSVALQPTVALGNYRDIRLPYEPKAVEDADVDRALRMLQEEEGVYEETDRPLDFGNRVKMELYAVELPADGSEPAAAEAETDEGDEAEGDHGHGSPGHGLVGEEFIHEHDMTYMLRQDATEDIAPGFGSHLLGAVVGDERIFDIDYPAETTEYANMAGKQARFKVIIHKIENVTLPSLNDELAARVTKDEEKPLTLLELRMRVRENLQKSGEDRYRDTYVVRMMDALVEQATIGYPDAMVEEEIEESLQRLDQSMRRSGLTLEDYLRMTKQDRATVGEMYRADATQRLKRSLAMSQLRETEQVVVSDADVEDEVLRTLERFGEQAEQMRSLVDSAPMRENIRRSLLEKVVVDRLVAIGRGEAPELVVIEAESGA